MTAQEQGLTACSGAELQMCTLSARGFELATFRLLVQRSKETEQEVTERKRKVGPLTVKAWRKETSLRAMSSTLLVVR